ncbi:MAG TPA: serine/threonine protein kinase [Planctomycetales bacterium]|jgi:serine/threonine protein kinase|nr:serine/threonine protein kinase [Planctomycetales bacterium]
MDIQDPDALGRQAVKVGLLTPEQLAEAKDEMGGGASDMMTMLRTLERKGWLTPYQSGKLLKGDDDGFLLGGYRLLYKIASGSFGRVFRAEDPRAGRVVALKVLRRRWSENQQHIDLFAREGRVGQTLKHPNIVEVLAMSHDKTTNQYYIVMEFVEGGNLREILQIRKKLSVAESLRILEDAVSGLAYAYARGVTHRDIKLTNLLISSQGSAKVVDFGLAQFFAALEKDAKDKEKVDRTVDYAGLERATNVKTGDVRSDIFFLGCVFYEMLTGRSPLPMSRDKNARMHKRRFEDIPLLPRDEVEAPPSVFLLTETMMALEPNRRYQTPSQLLDAVRAARRDVEGKPEALDGGDKPRRSLFVVESDERLQDAVRDKFKEMGYRVLIAADPQRALDRFRQQPYDALVVDAETAGEDARYVFEQVVDEAERKQFKCAGVLILGEGQAEWAGLIRQRPNMAVLVRPGVTIKVLKRTLEELLKE